MATRKESNAKTGTFVFLFDYISSYFYIRIYLGKKSFSD